ncbi:MAG: hypothetical protein J5449_12530 [Oscillospiraceae bacterium]|nr:hypothetical protein [Oscillospiraceae bacterium]
MDNQELRKMKEQLGLIDFKIGYKTGVHYGVIESFFSGKSDELSPKDREKIEALFAAEAKKKR